MNHPLFWRALLLSIAFGPLMVIPVLAQQPESFPAKVPVDSLNQQQIGRYLKDVNQKVSNIDQDITKTNQQYLDKLSGIEAKLIKKLQTSDSSAGKSLSPSKYQQLNASLKDTITKISRLGYDAKLDTLKTSLAFLQKQSGQVQSATQSITESQLLQNHLIQSAEIQQYISSRQQEISDLLNKYNPPPSGALQVLSQYKQTAYYYSAQVNTYKSMLSDPDKLASQTLTELNKLPAFQNFMSTHSELAALFPMPSGYGTAAALSGLQTRDSLQQQLQQKMGSSGQNSAQYMQQQADQGQDMLNQLKQKVASLGGNSSQMPMPDFQPNNQKTKTFLQRLTYGFNIQSQKNTYLLPVATEFSLTVGYKLNDKMTAGIGASYFMGWGTAIRHIHLSKQGGGLQSYFDIKVKGSIWATGGYEENYISAFSSLSQLNIRSDWQQSGLIGVMKTYSIGKSGGDIQLLWDFLSYYQQPQTTPIKFRVGYSF